MGTKLTYEELEQRVKELEKETIKRRQTDEALKESEKRYRMLFEKAGDAIFILQAEGTEAGKVVDTNQSAAEMHGYTVDELLAMNIKDLDTPAVAKQAPGRIRSMLAGEWIKAEITHRRKDGSVFPVEISAGLLELGDHKYILAFDRDISERKQAEKALKESELKHKTLVHNIPGMVYRGYSDWSAEIISGSEEICGYTNKELNSEKEGWLSIIHSDDKARVFREGSELAKQKQDTVQIYRIVTKAGDNRWVEDRKTPLFTEEGEFIGIDGIVFDITKRKQTEETLRESEEKYRLLVENIPSVVFKGYKDWSVEFFDRKIELLTGYDLDEFNSKRIKGSDIIVKEDIETARKRFIQALKTDKSYVREYRIKSKAGDIYWIQERGHIVCDDKGEIEYVSGTFFDITQTKHLQEQLVRSDRLAATGQLAASVAHQINSPLQAVTVLVDTMKKEFKKEGKPSEKIDLLGEAFVNIRDTVSSLHDLNRPGKEEKQPADVNEIIVKTYKLIRSHLKMNKVKVNMDLAPKMPIIIASPQQLSQVFLNLINNSIEAMSGESGRRNGREKPASIGGRIFVKTDLEKGDIIIEVADTGPGILKGDLGHIFDHFFTGKKKIGIGVGLSVCNGIIENHNGTITARNSPEGGAVFTITLPVA